MKNVVIGLALCASAQSVNKHRHVELEPILQATELLPTMVSISIVDFERKKIH